MSGTGGSAGGPTAGTLAHASARGRFSLRPGSLTPYLFLLPAIAVLGVFFVGAFVQVVYYSFTTYTAFSPPEFVGLDNYQRVFADERFWWCLLNSFIYLLVTPALILISLAAALIVRHSIRTGRWLRLLFFLPVVTPTIVAAVAWRLLFEDQGLINSIIALAGLDPIGWLTQRPWTLITAMTVTLWKGFGFYMMIFIAGLLAVPKELEEACSLDGAGPVRSFFAVVLPTIWPVVVLVGIISSISALKVFDELFVTIKGTPIEHQTVVPLVYEVAFVQGTGDFGLACAMGLVLFAIILVFSVVNLRLTGAVKGGRP